jgi:ribokinase
MMEKAMEKPRILVVGSMNMDLLVYGTPKIPEYGESVRCESYEFMPGGKGSNQAFAASRLGARSAMVGCIGDDDYGHNLASELEKAGVDTQFLVFDKEERTGLALMCVEKTGRYLCYVTLGANMKLDGAAVERALAADNFDLVMMQLEMPEETVYATHELASRRGIPVFLDAGPPMPVELERLRGLYILSPNEAETQALTGIAIDTGESALAAARQLYGRAAPRWVILKMGSRGVFFYDGKEGRLMPTFDIKTVDSTAAGDTFNAALAVRLCKGEAVEQAINAAQAAATICVSRRGALPSIPTLEEVEAFIKSDPPALPGRG